MATVLLATQEIYERLNGYVNGNSLLEFVQDGNNNWVVSEDVLNDEAFIDIREDLSALDVINYVPKSNE